MQVRSVRDLASSCSPRLTRIVADKSGKLEFGELCELLPGIGVNEPEIEVRAVFESLDVDKSGELDFHEFLSLVLSVCTDQVRQLDATSE